VYKRQNLRFVRTSAYASVSWSKQAYYIEGVKAGEDIGERS